MTEEGYSVSLFYEVQLEALEPKPYKLLPIAYSLARSAIVPVTYLLLDGHFGNNNALPMTRQVNLHLISKLRYDSALYLPYKNPTPERKCRRKYGKKLNICQIPNSFLKNSHWSGDLRNDFPRSAILKGEVRMRENTLTLQEHQFLITANDQDIQKLRYFALSSYPSVGVQVRLAGESQELGVGLDPDYPVQTLIPSWLSRYLTPDEITAALSFCAAVIGFLLPYLFTPSSEN